MELGPDKDGEEPEHEVLQNETQTKLPPVDDWQRFNGTPAPGHVFAFDLQATRRKLLESGRCPKITLKNGTEIASLQYRCVQAKDGCSGVCVIRELPPQKKEIEEWLGNLPRAIEWRGDGIPSPARAHQSRTTNAFKRRTTNDFKGAKRLLQLVWGDF